MVAVPRVSVNHHERRRTAPDPVVWRERVEHRKVEIRVNVDLAALPGPLGFLNGSWFRSAVDWSLSRMLLLGFTALVCCALAWGFCCLELLAC